jgi:ABC-type uncharacterized transport system ATPase subunit
MRITLHDIHKHYGQVHANDGITMEIAPGTIHGVLGENGAGKSTLMKILAGYAAKTSGTIFLDGRPSDFAGPSQATELGMGMLYQDPLDFAPLTVLENFMMGLAHGIARSEAFYRQKLEDIALHFNFYLNPETTVRNLTVGERQQLELVRLLALGVDVLILDEPTTGISSVQRQTLFSALRKLAEEQKTILLVSHKFEDVEALCDRVTVLRQGKVAGEMDRPFETSTLLQWMFRSLPQSPPCAPTKELFHGLALTLEGVAASGGRVGLRPCDITIRKGEIVGIAGLEGSGQEIFLRVAAGLKKPDQGRIQIEGKDMTREDHHAFRSEGVTFLPAARLEEGLMPGLTITEHFALGFGRGIRVPRKEATELAQDGIRRFRIVGEPHTRAESLSGGNQQRLLLALLPSKPRVLVLEHPTRGLDLDSVSWVWEKLMAFAMGGASILFSSAELEEILQVADRILVFFNGVVVKDTRRCDTTLPEVAQAIAGKL